MNINEYTLNTQQNIDKAVKSIPKKLIEKENSFFDKLSQSPLSNVKKLELIYSFMQQLSDAYESCTPCKKGCSICCSLGAITIHDVEIELIKKKYKLKGNIIKPKENGYCHFLKDGQCSIYDARPYVCRRYHSFYKDNSACLPNNQKILRDAGIQETILEFSEIKKLFNTIIRDSNSKRHTL